MSRIQDSVISLIQLILFTVVFMGPFIEQGRMPYEYRYFHIQDSLSLLLIGILLTLVSLIVMGFATRFGLDPNHPFSILPGFPRSHYLLTDGIYKYIRHPQSLGWLIGALGYLLIMDAKFTWLFWPICLMFFIIQIPYEEKLLKLKYSEYEAYAERTYRILPFVW